MKDAASRNSGKRSRRFPWVRSIFYGMIACLVLPILQAGSVRWINPPLTPLMLVRKAEALVGKKSSTTVRYEWRSLESMPPDFIHFTLLAEDQRFFQHSGFDWKEVEAAKREAKRTGKPIRGASTISMQCARSLFLWQGRSWLRKGLELYYTFWLETFVPKRRILELYVNVIEMGDGVYGLPAAARAHFNVEPRALNRDQCARLATLLPAPLVWNPKTPSPRYQKRFTRLLRTEQAKVPGWEQLRFSAR